VKASASPVECDRDLITVVAAGKAVQHDEVAGGGRVDHAFGDLFGAQALHRGALSPAVIAPPGP
jgi:hypothetical protein